MKYEFVPDGGGADDALSLQGNLCGYLMQVAQARFVAPLFFPGDAQSTTHSKGGSLGRRWERAGRLRHTDFVSFAPWFVSQAQTVPEFLLGNPWVAERPEGGEEPQSDAEDL